jgi:sugar diacid utilization regulator
VHVLLKDVLQLPVLKGSRLLTDHEAARHKHITSVSVIEVPVGKFIRPGDLVLTTGMNVGQNAQSLSKFVKEIAESGAATLAIAIGPHTHRIPKQVIKVASRFGLPLIELPWELRFSEISEAILRQLIHETSKIRSRDEFVWSLASRTATEDTAIAHGRQLGFDITRKFVAVVAKFSDATVLQPEKTQSVARFVEGLCGRIATQNQLHWVGTIVGDRVIGYLQLPRGKQKVQQLLAEIQTVAAGKCSISWGVGGICNSYSDFAKSYEDARIACDLGIAIRGNASITDISDILPDRVLMNVQRDSHALMLLHRYIEPLERLQRVPLLRTLECFFETDCNASQTARELSISRQSLLYRLKRIESVLNINLHDPETRFAVLFSLRLHRLHRLKLQKERFDHALRP